MTVLPLFQSRRRGIHWHKPDAPVIESLPLPDILRFRVSRACGQTADISVSIGQRVLKGQPLTHSTDTSMAMTHASSSGKVTGIHNGTITIATDGLHQSIVPQQCDTSALSKEDLVRIAHNTGLIGQGGAGFPLAKKLEALASPAQLLLVNAAECDPLMHCDDALIQSRSTEIIQSLNTIASACAIKNIVIGIEDNKPAAKDAINQAIANPIENTNAGIDFKIVPVTAIYPSGAERILLELCTDIKVPGKSSLAACGVLSMNVSTCDALGRSINTGLPPHSRITTVVSPGGELHNFEVLLGTPVRHLFEHLRLTEQQLHCSITQGGQMMYTAIDHDAPVTQRSNCINFSESKETIATPCIRCGACSDVCPANLLPQTLHKAATLFNAEQLQHARLPDCIECRCCDVVCPSQIPLTQQFKQAKQQMLQLQQEQQAAAIARRRYEKREQRLLAQSSGNRKKRLKEKPAPKTPQSRKDLIAQALQRKKKPAGNSDTGSFN